MQQVVAACATCHDVYGREDALVGQSAVELQFHVTRALELFENHFVHLGTSVGQCSGNDGQRTSTLNVARSTEEALGLVHGIGVHTTRQHLARCGSHRIVGASQTGNGVKEDDYIVTTFHHALILLQHDAGNLHVPLCGLVECRGYDLGIHRAGHVGHFLGTLIDEQHHQVCLGMIACNAVGNVLQQQGLTRLGLGNDECTLSLADRSKEVYDTRRKRIAIARAQGKLFVGEEWSQVLERTAVAGNRGVAPVDADGSD